MKHFVYTFTEKTPRGGHTQYTIKIYQIKKNVPHYLGSMTDTFTGEGQLFLDALESFKLFPKIWFKRGPHGSREVPKHFAKDKGWYTATGI